jgi:hypothetical protein
MALEFKVEGYDDLIKDVKHAGGNARKLVTAALQNSVGKMQSNIRQRAAHKTGTLQRSVLTRVDYPEAQVHVQEKYGAFLEFGTGIYGPENTPIRPKSKKALYFQVAGKPVFARSVKGIRPKPFFAPGVEASRTYVDQQFDHAHELIVKQLAGKA